MRRENTAQAKVLIEVSGQSVAKDMALVIGFAGFIGVFAQISVHLPFTPVPITGQTFAVLLGASVLGPLRSLAGSLFYLAFGLLGVPWFAGGTGGVGVAAAPSFGYLIGFVVAGTVVGYLAQLGFDKSALGSIGEMVIGNLVIYSFGLTWLVFSLHVNFTKAVMLGARPFLIGDLLKIILASALLPAAWKLVGRMNRHDSTN